MNDRTDRIAMLARELSRLDHPRDLAARRLYLRARDELAAVVRAGANAEIVQCYRYRAERAQEVLTAALHPPAAAAC